MKTLLPLLGLSVVWSCAFAAPTPFDLRCDWGSDPIGVDSTPPRLSWKYLPEHDNTRPTSPVAWQVLVASSQEILDADRGDLWDSGRVDDDRQVNVPYAGVSLASHQQVFWKVRSWDQREQASPWSDTTTWTMGALDEAGWSGAQWITAATLLEWRRPALGYRSLPASSPDTTKWIQLDLGQARSIEAVVLHGLRHTVAENLGFPRRFKAEVSHDPAFATSTVIADQTAADFRNAWATRIELKPPAGPITARHVRVTATQLRATAGEICLALSQLVVREAGRNVAPGSTITTSDSIEEKPWSAAAAIDGSGEPGINPLANSTLLLRRSFEVAKPVRRALLHVSGLGHAQVSINGTPHLRTGFLTPGWTDYDKTCLYDSFDVTRDLSTGRNTLGLILAGGMYNLQDGRYTKFVTDFRPLTAKATLRIEYVDGTVETVVTDETWSVAPGPTTFANLFGGEDHDARLAPTGWDEPWFDDAGWTRAQVWAGPSGQLRGFSHASPPFTTEAVLKPVASNVLRPGVTVHDFGQNTAMVLNLSVRGPRGATVKITPGELLKKDGSIERGSSGGREVWWHYTLAGSDDVEFWMPRFFYHGSRYLQVEVAPAEGSAELPVVETIESVVAHSDSPRSGEFACSNDLFNRIRLLVQWAQRSNLAHVFTDCPHRERLGWLEQYHLNGPSLRYESDVTRLFAKTFADMADAQQPDGFIPNIAPEFIVFSEAFRESPEWGSAVILAAWQHYIWTGDDTTLHRNYEVMQRYLADLSRKAKGHILDFGLGDWYDIGPNPPGYSQLTPRALTATAIYFECASRLADIATHLKHTGDARLYNNLAFDISEAFNAAFLKPGTATYATGSQTSQAMPLVLGLVPDAYRAAALETLVRDIEGRGNAVTAGDVGYRYVLRALADGGRSDVIFAMNNQSDKPGYGYQLAQGATSLTEAWDARRGSSQNHFMLGQIIEWFYGDLAGISPDPEHPGFKNILIRPRPVGDVTWARAGIETPRGRAGVSWAIHDGSFTLEIDVPIGATANVVLPYGEEDPVHVGPGRHAFSVAVP